MMLKSKSSQSSKRSAWTLLRAGVAGLGVVLGGAAVTAGCLDRPVAPAVPKTSNVYVDEIRQTAVDKIDLLFMIDNSISMADKQAILAEAVPLLVTRLITPICVDNDGVPTGGNANNMGECPNGATAEFSPIKDIHVGVITSSLGSHGASGPKDVCVSAEDDDHAHLLGQIRPNVMPPLQPYVNPGVPEHANGFLKWDVTDNKYNPPGESNGEAFTTKFTAMVTAAGEKGCGYEASLESWYRFLIDPEPPAAVVVPQGSSTAVVMGVDQVVLDQRKAFLRPDSLVAVVMLSDENDCSIQDEGYGWLIARGVPMYRSTSQCLTNPNDKCCQSCGEQTANDGCPAIASDVECAKSTSLNMPGEDDLNLRCWQQKRRFGFELLYPTTRYADGLRSPVVPKRSTGELVQNPLFEASDGKTSRDKGLVFLAGIVGVPWQDIADPASLTGPDLRYLTAAQITSEGRWDVILGDPKASPPVLPTDPLMVETPDDRTTLGIPQANPITNDALVPASSTNPTANKINGHEQHNMGGRDLQYACTFPLGMPISCTPDREANNQGCDCFEADLVYNRPLCQPPGGGAASIEQNFAKAYPGVRHLQVLKEFGENSVVASICPKILDNGNPDYGYNPAVKAIIDRLKEALKGKCLPRPLIPADQPQDGLETGQVPCKVIEAVLPTGGGCVCNGQTNRADTSTELRQAVLNKLKEGQTCGTNGGTPCDSFCTCELKQLTGQELQTCQNSESPPSTPGYCYVNAAPNEPHVGNPDLVKDCTADSKRLLRFVGDTPAPGAIALVACLGASLGSVE
jgi:hypothetical protein